MERIRIWGTTPEGHIIEANVSKQIQGVLYLNGENGNAREVWLFHHAELKDGKGKDTIKIPYKERHNEKTDKGIATKTVDKKLEIPVTYELEVKKLGERQFVLHRTGKIKKVRVHVFVHGEDLTDDIWNYLTEREKAHLETIDVWSVYDELVRYLNSEKKDPKKFPYIQALQEIYNETLFKNYSRYVKYEPEMEKIPTHTLANADILLTIKAGKYTETKHFTGGGIFECKDEIKRTFAFTLPRDAIFTANLKGKYKITKGKR